MEIAQGRSNDHWQNYNYYLWEEKIYQILQYEKAINSGLEPDNKPQVVAHALAINAIAFQCLNSKYTDLINIFERKIKERSDNKPTCILLTAEAIIFFALCIGHSSYLEMKLDTSTENCGYAEYLNSKKNKFLKNLQKQDKLKDGYYQNDKHVFDACYRIIPGAFTTDQFKKLINFYDCTTPKSKISPKIVAKNVSLIFNAYLSLSPRNTKIARKTLEVFLNDIFLNSDWERPYLFKHAKEAFNFN